MPSYKLTYFNARGRAEVARLIFAQAGVDYEDNRIERESWPTLKPTTSFGQLPELEVDGQKIGQSDTIARYLAKEFGMAGKTPMEEALANSVVDSLGDLLVLMVKIHYAKNDEEKKESMEKVPVQLACLESYLVKQNGGDGFFVGDGLTWADLKAYDLISGLKARFPDAAKTCPKLSAHCDRIANLPNIKAWVEKRPTTDI